ncbi:MAG: VWA domain-containing protein [Oleiphilaceae bacterium]|nr:VWA domain-containing protein [Oleiphilaceae bacterium]
MSKSHFPRTQSTSVDQFLEQVKRLPQKTDHEGRGRLIFAMDATASRQPMWDMASHLHAQMFEQVAQTGDLQVQLCYYRGYREFYASPWAVNASELSKEITGVECLAGRTQIARILRHALREHAAHKVAALVFVGDCVEESIDKLGDLAGQLGIHGIKAFLFQEGRHSNTTRAFAHMARLSGGAHCQFDANSASQLGALLAAVAVYAAGGRRALQHHRLADSAEVKGLLEQLNS